MPNNSCEATLLFRTRDHAESFLINAPGEGTANAFRVFKRVEGDADAARELKEFAKRAERHTTEIKIREYHVS